MLLRRTTAGLCFLKPRSLRGGCACKGRAGHFSQTFLTHLPRQTGNSPLCHQAFSPRTHFREMGTQSRNTPFHLLLGDPLPCCALPALQPWPRVCGRGGRLLLMAPSALPCPSASGWVQPMEDRRDKRQEDEKQVQGVTLLSRPGHTLALAASSAKPTFCAPALPRLLEAALLAPADGKRFSPSPFRAAVPAGWLKPTTDVEGAPFFTRGIQPMWECHLLPARTWKDTGIP